MTRKLDLKNYTISLPDEIYTLLVSEYFNGYVTPSQTGFKWSRTIEGDGNGRKNRES